MEPESGNWGGRLVGIWVEEAKKPQYFSVHCYKTYRIVKEFASFLAIRAGQSLLLSILMETPRWR